MHVKVGTFNLNNLFSRFNFSAEVGDDEGVEVETRTTFSFDDPSEFKLRTYQGQLVKGKPKAARQRIASRIADMNLDVLAVQEVEDVDTLAQFARPSARTRWQERKRRTSAGGNRPSRWPGSSQHGCVPIAASWWWAT